MARHRLRASGRVYRHIMYDGMHILPVEDSQNRWHVPGGRVLTTKQLVSMARHHRVPVSLVETSGNGSTTRPLI